MRRITFLLILIFTIKVTSAQNSFNIRGVLPWHNFLSGPSAWNEEDYRKYLDDCKSKRINFIGFHNYTGGGERYATYVEPMIKISYKGILPQAYFDNSLSARWGYLPMKLSDFAFNSNKAYQLESKYDAFGSEASIASKSTKEHYDNSQGLMKKVLLMAHERGIQMAMGFEFGVIPPEYFSLNIAGDCFYWAGQSTMIPNPKNQIAIDLHYAAIDNILETYPDIDWIWLWLNEHSFMSVDLEKALKNKPFKEAFDKNSDIFTGAKTDEERFVGVWALEYIRLTYDYLKKKGSKAGIILGGWGGGNQLPALLTGLDKALPKDIVFSCLNPNLGKEAQPLFLSEIGKNRKVWAVPWLEGDHQLWHFQPRVDMISKQVKLAADQHLDGVIAIHWRTEETRFNMNAFSYLASNPASDKTTEQLYAEYIEKEFGKQAVDQLVPLLVKMDVQQIHWNVPSPEFYAYTPEWGKLDEQNKQLRQSLVDKIIGLLSTAQGDQLEALKRFKAMFEFELLLNEVGRSMDRAYQIKKTETESGTVYAEKDFKLALKQLQEAPLQKMFDAYTRRINSRGELGVLSSLNQRVWSEYMELQNYLNHKLNQ